MLHEIKCYRSRCNPEFQFCVPSMDNLKYREFCFNDIIISVDIFLKITPGSLILSFPFGSVMDADVARLLHPDLENDFYGPLIRYVKLQVAHAPRMSGTFSLPLRISDPDMHHGTCVTHVPWCMSGSLTGGFLCSRWRGIRSRHSLRTQFYVFGKRTMWKTISSGFHQLCVVLSQFLNCLIRFNALIVKLTAQGMQFGKESFIPTKQSV